MLSGPVTRISSSSFLEIWRRRERGADGVKVAVSQRIQALDLPTGDARRWREKLYRILVYWFHHAAQAAAWREGADALVRRITPKGTQPRPPPRSADRG